MTSDILPTFDIEQTPPNTSELHVLQTLLQSHNNLFHSLSPHEEWCQVSSRKAALYLSKIIYVYQIYIYIKYIYIYLYKYIYIKYINIYLILRRRAETYFPKFWSNYIYLRLIFNIL